MPSVQPEPYDFVACPHCLEPMLKVAYWDEAKGAVGNLCLQSDFQYPWKNRDVKDRLVVFSLELASASRHELFCKNKPKDEDWESPPYQGARGRRG